MKTTSKRPLKSRPRYRPTPSRYGKYHVAILLAPEDWEVWRKYVLAHKDKTATALGRDAIMAAARAFVDEKQKES